MSTEFAAGRLLIATTELHDLNFKRSVILLCRQAPGEGALGLILNRRTTIPVGKALPQIARDRKEAIWIGGPVDERSFFILHRIPSLADASDEVMPGLFMATDMTLIQRILKESPPDPEGEFIRPCIGYSGWGPGQLESEIAAGAWRVASAPAGTLFDCNPRSLWRDMMTRSILTDGRGCRPPFLN